VCAELGHTFEVRQARLRRCGPQLAALGERTRTMWQLRPQLTRGLCLIKLPVSVAEIALATDR
jgi:hypothetical protein